MKSFFNNRMNLSALVAVIVCLIGIAIFGSNIETDLIAIGAIIVRITTAGYAGYWLHKGLFKDFRPDEKDLKSDAGNMYQLSRAIVVGSAMIAAGYTI